MNTIYTVSEAAEKLGISAKTLRRWEETDRFHSNRTIGGQRRYSTEDIQILDAIAHNLIPSDKELLTISQAAAIAGVREEDIKDWEAQGRIHTFITSEHTFFVKSHLLANLPKASVEPVEQPVEQSVERVVCPKLTPLSISTTRTTAASWHHDLQLVILNILFTTVLLAGYHLIAGSPDQATPRSPSPTPVVQGVSTQVDPKLELIKSLVDSSGNITTAGTMRVSGQFITPRVVLSPISRPLSPTAGMLYFDAGTQTLELFTGTAWAIVFNPAPVATSSAKVATSSAVLNR